jgi:2-oxoisovalerate dehydrogenase E2 component (dihydrolipoyl transacylase)
VEAQFRLPDVGEGLTEAEIVAWRVKPGDVVSHNQVIVEIETAKSLVELPSPYTGTVTSLLAEEGTTVEVGSPIIGFDVAGDGQQPADPPPGRAAASQAPPGPAQPAGRQGSESSPEAHPVLVGYGVRPGLTSRRPRKDPGTRPRSAPAAPAGPRALAKPPVRRLARDLGVDIDVLTGSGPHGSVTRDDVRNAAGSGTVRSEPGKREERIPLRGVRKAMATAMVASAFTAPHVTEFLQVDVTETMSAVQRIRGLPEFAEVKVSPLLFVARALLAAAARHPMINSSRDEAAQEIVVKRYVNLGIAVASDRGLLVPTIKDAHAMTLAELARSLDSLTATARSGKATPADLSGGTITITNVGVFGIDAGTPILTPGEAAILAFGAIQDRPWVVDGQLAVRKVTTLSLSFDHSIVDGELGSAVLRDVGWLLTDPIRMLAWS